MKTEALYDIFSANNGICTDTRNITPNCIFFALKGDNFNGNAFAEEAIKKGAFKTIIDEKEFHKDTGETILVDDVLKILQELALFHRKKLNLPIIALTGSNGKTTTKELINAVLSQKYKTTATKGNLNNHIGVPLTLLSMDKSTEIGIVEMGANHPNEIARLCEIAMPDFGYITNFGKAHLEGFGSLEGVVNAKTELYEHLKKHGKTVFINEEDPIQIKRSNGMKKIVFCEKQEGKLKLLEASNKVKVQFKDVEIQSNLIGVYNFPNIAAAISMGDYFGVSEEKIKHAIEGYFSSNNRSQLLEKNGNKIILDAYNANPSSMLAALENFKQAEGENKILFLGDMFELGNDADAEHQNIINFLEDNSLGEVYIVGSNFHKTLIKSPQIHKYKSFEDLKIQLEKNPQKDKFILIKASRGMALERIMDIL